ncbi:MAG: DoxX family protein [Opitutus sp.]|nr:DoxX family protein [Opitutus sp.]
MNHAPETNPPRSRARIAATIARVLLGLGFFVFGGAGLFNLLPPPPPGTMPAGAEAFSGALFATGYMLPLIKGTETLCGLLLLLNRFVPLALVVLAPVVLNIVAFHVFLAPSGTAVAIVFLALELYLAWVYRAAFRPLLIARNAT